METKINTEIQKVLEQFDQKYILEGVINKSKVIQDLDKYDNDLVTAILSNEELKQRFTMKIADTTIIKVNDLIEIFELDDYWQDSYTKYTKKIGLTVNGKFLDETSEVVLDFPYKDTILKASMSKEDNGKDDLRPDEPFLNEIIAQDEIDVLLDEKILVNAKKYDKDGEHEVTEFSAEDNLILKGNNLLALHTLKERYAGKVKQIIIDPPYYFTSKKSSDAFNYNSNFKLSTWLVFMKNRLEMAKELLHELGFIFIIIGEDGLAQLKLLCDKIFDSNNYVGMITWRKSDNQANIGEFAKVSDYILIYKKTDSAKLNKLPLSEKAKKEYRYSDINGDFRRQILLHKTRGRYYYDLTTPSGKILKGPWMKPKEILLEMDSNNEIYWTKGGEEQPYGKLYLSQSNGQIANDFWDTTFGSNQRGSTEMKTLFDNRAFDFPKPELLIKNLIFLGSAENDLILDFFMGSATTQAVAMKMNRRFIGIEQMDYINTVSVPRLQKVIEGEQGGISKDVNWQGGGSFVYAELMEKNTGFIKEISNAKNSTDLKSIFNRMTETADLDFRADLAKLENSDLWLEPLDDQKRLLIKIIDKNQLYYNYSEIDDENVRDLISASDYAFNQSFYKSEREE